MLAVYRPKPGCNEALLRETAEHVPLLRRLGLATDHPATALRAPDGTVVELFEWRSADTIAAAHEHPEVLAMWGRYAECSDYATLADLPNAASMFAEFELIGTY